uniref:Uncharacterized protein n=1 Tax=Rhizophora mucronata TaxID=61149 RepID=A0A2P2Q9I8_RHIMU
MTIKFSTEDRISPSEKV